MYDITQVPEVTGFRTRAGNAARLLGSISAPAYPEGIKYVFAISEGASGETVQKVTVDGSVSGTSQNVNDIFPIGVPPCRHEQQLTALRECLTRLEAILRSNGAP